MSGDSRRRRESPPLDVSVEQFLEATGLTNPDTARRYIDLAGGDSNAAVLLYLAEQDISASESSSSSSSSSSSLTSSPSRRPTTTGSGDRREHRGEERPREASSRREGRTRKGRDVIPTASSSGRYAGQGDHDDGEHSLRKPDPSYTQTLLSGSAHPFRDASASSINDPGGGDGIPFCEEDAAALPSSLTVGCDVRSAAFAGLYEPPKELVCTLPFAKAKDLSVKTGRWLLVNIQKADVFDSHMLNRDIWRAEIVQDLIKEFFVFWQRAESTSEGKVFCELYKVCTFPHIAVIDPRTGRSMKQWSFRRFSEPVGAQSELFEFLEKQEELAKARQASSSSSSSSMTPASSSSPTSSLPPHTSPSFTSSPGATSSSSSLERGDYDHPQGASQSTGRGGEREQPCSSTSSSSLCSSVAREDRNTRTPHESHNTETEKGELRNFSTAASNWREGATERPVNTERQTTSHMSSSGRSETSASCSSQEGRVCSPTSYENTSEVERRRVSSSSSLLGKRNGSSGADEGGVRSEATQIENQGGGESDDRRETEGQSPPRPNLRELREKRLKALEQRFEK